MPLDVVKEQNKNANEGFEVKKEANKMNNKNREYLHKWQL